MTPNSLAKPLNCSSRNGRHTSLKSTNSRARVTRQFRQSHDCIVRLLENLEYGSLTGYDAGSSLIKTERDGWRQSAVGQGWPLLGIHFGPGGPVPKCWQTPLDVRLDLELRTRLIGTPIPIDRLDIEIAIFALSVEKAQQSSSIPAPACSIRDVDWDSCSISGCSPERLPGSLRGGIQ